MTHTYLIYSELSNNMILLQPGKLAQAYIYSDWIDLFIKSEDFAPDLKIHIIVDIWEN